MENNSCSVKGPCPVKSCLCKLLCFALPTFVLLAVMGYLIHHVWLMPFYMASSSLWRSGAEMQNNMPMLMGYYGVLSIVISGLFCKVYKARKAMCEGQAPEVCAVGGKKCPIKYGVCFGILIGLLLGTMAAGPYIWMPIPSELAVRWFFAWVIEGAVIGAVLGAIGHCKSKKCNEAK